MKFIPSNQSLKVEEVAIATSRQNLATIATLCSDHDADVRARAVRSLEHFAEDADRLIELACLDPEPKVRVAAASASVTHPRVTIASLLEDKAPEVVEAACFAVGERVDSEHRTKIELIASGHENPLCRESAVAALGVLGDPRSLEIILGALDDKAYIRRRAVVALSAFEGPSVDDALNRCLTDRDHQVRQLAEDLLQVE